jgi:hypothetical protein
MSLGLMNTRIWTDLIALGVTVHALVGADGSQTFSMKWPPMDSTYDAIFTITLSSILLTPFF